MSLSWSMNDTPVAYSVMRPMKKPIMTHRPLVISFLLVQPNTLQCARGRGRAGWGG